MYRLEDVSTCDNFASQSFLLYSWSNKKNNKLIMVILNRFYIETWVGDRGEKI